MQSHFTQITREISDQSCERAVLQERVEEAITKEGIMHRPSS